MRLIPLFRHVRLLQALQRLLCISTAHLIHKPWLIRQIIVLKFNHYIEPKHLCTRGLIASHPPFRSVSIGARRNHSLVFFPLPLSPFSTSHWDHERSNKINNRRTCLPARRRRSLFVAFTCHNNLSYPLYAAPKDPIIARASALWAHTEHKTPIKETQQTKTLDSIQ